MARTRKCGHATTTENTVYETRNGKLYSNGCRTCRNAYMKVWQEQDRRQAGMAPRPVPVVSDPNLKVCSACGDEKTLDEFSPRLDRPDGYSRGRSSQCKPCASVKSRRWQESNPDKVKSANYRAYHALKREVLAHYSTTADPQCVCCGEAGIVFLALDHVDNDGGTHRRTIGQGQVLRWIKRNDFPAGFQTLCMNCNWAKHALGSCPHKSNTS